MGEDDVMFWQDVLDDLVAGRPPSPCPFCKAPGLKIEARGAVTRIECPACRHFIEGQLAVDEAGMTRGSARSGDPQ